jgi:hypothetical protein
MRDARRLAQHILLPGALVGEDRLARQWSVIDLRTARRASSRGRGRAFLAAASMAAVAAAAWLFLAGRHAHAPLPQVMDGAAIEGGVVTLADGSRVAVGEGGRVRIASVRPGDVDLVLEAGSASFEVPHTNRRVVVHAGRYEVVDLGTRFHVALGNDSRVEVDVAEGSVEVRTSHEVEAPRRLSAGDHWSNAAVAVAPPPAAAPPASPPTTPDVAPPPPAVAPPAPVPAATASVPSKSAMELLELSKRQRLAGNTRAAAAALDALRRRHRTDPRAPLAAYELARLRLYAFGDAPGAVEAFNDSIALAPNGPSREDAEALRVEALDIEHSPECASSRDAFLARYPRSIHRAVVAGRCVGP